MPKERFMIKNATKKIVQMIVSAKSEHGAESRRQEPAIKSV